MFERVDKPASQRVRHMAIALTVLAVASWAVRASAQKLPWEDTPDAGGKAPATVRFDGPEQVSVTPHHPQVVELRFRIQDGYHINSHTPHEKSFIPTQLMVVDGEGVTVSAVDFPPGTDTSFSFAPKEKLSVYTGELTLRAHVTAEPGGHLLQGALRYQACNANACMPPRKIPVAVSVIGK
jgi:thiol:disulfide interchange protein